jgi:hypothetical protein
MWHVRLVLKEYPCGIVVQTTREDLNQARCPDRERSDRRPLIRLLFFRVLILGEYMGGDVWAALEQQGDNLCLPYLSNARELLDSSALVLTCLRLPWSDRG